MTNKNDDPAGSADVSELARRLAAQRQIVEGICEVCGKPFTGTRKRLYCSHNCAQKAYLARNKSTTKTEGKGDGR